jgi:hypothetical protein
MKKASKGVKNILWQYQLLLICQLEPIADILNLIALSLSATHSQHLQICFFYWMEASVVTSHSLVSSALSSLQFMFLAFSPTRICVITLLTNLNPELFLCTVFASGESDSGGDGKWLLLHFSHFSGKWRNQPKFT